jgi:hypothetical protein
VQNIKNKVVVITGASSGLGAETARQEVYVRHEQDWNLASMSYTRIVY